MNRIAELRISIEYDKSTEDINKFVLIYDCIHQILAENDILQNTVNEYKADPNNVELNLKFNLHRGSINHYFQKLMKIYDGNIEPIIKKFEEIRVAESNYNVEERNLTNSVGESYGESSRGKIPKEHILNLLVHRKKRLNAPSLSMNPENRLQHYEKHPSKLYDEYRKNLNKKLFTDLDDNYLELGLSENVINYIQKNRYMKWFYYTFYSAILPTTLSMGKLLLYFIDPNTDVYSILIEKLEYIHNFTSAPAIVLEKRLGFEYSVFTESNLLHLFKDLYASFVDLIKTTVLPNLIENKMNPINISRLLSIHEKTDPNLYFSILNIYIDSVRFYQDIKLVNYEKINEANKADEADESISLIILREILVFCRLFYKKINYYYPFTSSLLCLDEKYLSLPLMQDEFIKVINFYIIQLLVLQNQYYIYFSIFNYGLVKYFRELMHVDYELRFLSFSQDVGGKSKSEIKKEIFILGKNRNNLLKDVKRFVIDILINNDEKLNQSIEEYADEELKNLLRKYYDNIKIFINKMSDYFKISLSPRELIENLSGRKVLSGQYAIESHFDFRTYHELKYSDLIIKLEDTNNILSEKIDEFLKIPIDYYANFFAYGENSHLLFDIYQNMSVVEIIILSREFQQNLGESENMLNIIKGNFERLLSKYKGYIPPEKKNVVDIIRYQIAFFMSRENIYYYHCKSKEWANHVFEKYMNKNVKFIEPKQEVNNNKNLKFVEEAKPETATVNKNTLPINEFIKEQNLKNIKRNINGIKLGKLKQDDIEKYKRIFKKSIPDFLANEAKRTQYETRKKMFLKKYIYPD
jgi:hypothetical protein